MERAAGFIRMKIAVIAAVVPFRTHGETGVTAAHLVTAALLRAFRAQGHDVSLLCMLHQSRDGTLSSAEQKELKELADDGIRILDPVFLKNTYLYRPVSFRAIKLLFGISAAIAHFYPGKSAEGIVHRRLREVSPDVVVPVWAQQGVAATYRFTDAPVVPYQGDIDFEPIMCRLVRDRKLFVAKSSLFGMIDGWLRLIAHKRAHLRMMRGMAGIAHNAASNATYYERRNFPFSEYVGSLWPSKRNRPENSKGFRTPRKIIGHVGYLNRTGSTYGLRFLLRDVLPHLEKKMKDDFKVHIIGGGEPVPFLAPLLSHRKIVRHGFVEDLDAFLDDADVVCLFNNAAPYLAAYTRHMLAFAGRQCLIAHERSKQAVPELEHGKNCLLCKNGEHAAEMIADACTNPQLNNALREGGASTYERSFTAEATAKRIESLLLRVVEQRKAVSGAVTR